MDVLERYHVHERENNCFHRKIETIFCLTHGTLITLEHFPEYCVRNNIRNSCTASLFSGVLFSSLFHFMYIHDFCYQLFSRISAVN